MHPALFRTLLVCTVLAGCTPEPPEKERRPEPQASVSPPTADPAMPQGPTERARAAQGTQDGADQRQRDAIEDAGG